MVAQIMRMTQTYTMIFPTEIHYKLANLAIKKGVEMLELKQYDNAKYFSSLAKKHFELAKKVEVRNQAYREWLHSCCA